MNGFNPYSALTHKGNKVIQYNGNKIFPEIANICDSKFVPEIANTRLQKILKEEDYFYHLHRIDNALFFGATDFFRSIEADWCTLPLTTLMISSPGEVYAGKILDYTTDSLPVELSWFNNERKIFLSESSQFYLELRLLSEKVKKVFSIYNSFRKEPADFCHLSEFQHIEFEGKVNFDENIDIAIHFLQHVTDYIVEKEPASLAYFIGIDKVPELSKIFAMDNFEKLPFKKAMQILHDATQDEKYAEFSLKNFGAWEEVMLSEILGKHAIITQYPLMEIPFYHNEMLKDPDGDLVAENADFIFYGYREVIGSGSRIVNTDALAEKAKQFNLPEEDYKPYLESRRHSSYEKTSGFGMGWQRYMQWLLQLPHIWDATHIPRGHHLPKP